MDLYPLFNSIRIAIISTVIIFFLGIFAAHYISKMGSVLKGILDVFLTLPLVLPPTVVGYLLIRLLGPRRPLGRFFLDNFNINLTMNWWSAIFATGVVVFPLMYRTTRGAFEAFDLNLEYAARTLGLKKGYIFWKIKLPYCKKGIISGLILSFARALGEYGATSMISGYTPGKTATISTTIYQLWRTDNDELAFKWIMVNLLISALVLIFINVIDAKGKEK